MDTAWIYKFVKINMCGHHVDKCARPCKICVDNSMDNLSVDNMWIVHCCPEITCGQRVDILFVVHDKYLWTIIRTTKMWTSRGHSVVLRQYTCGQHVDTLRFVYDKTMWTIVWTTKTWTSCGLLSTSKSCRQGYARSNYAGHGATYSLL